MSVCYTTPHQKELCKAIHTNNFKILGYAVLQTKVKDEEIAKVPYFTNAATKTTAPATNSTQFISSTPIPHDARFLKNGRGKNAIILNVPTCKEFVSFQCF